MIILKIKNNAGPGNQMFMYSMAYSLARKYNKRILIVSEISGFSVRQNILQKFCLNKNVLVGIIRFDWIKNQYIFRLLRKIVFDFILKLPIFCQISHPTADSRVYKEVGALKKERIYVIDGYWECHRYFDDYREELVEQFCPKYILDNIVREKIDVVSNEENVVVHIRKGDFKDFGRLIDDDYYISSYERLIDRFPSLSLYVLTEDDKIYNVWKDRFQAKRIEFNTKNKYIDEWYVMSKCKYHIIANSTYSWWASYISNRKGKEVMIPTLGQYLLAENNNDETMYDNYYV